MLLRPLAVRPVRLLWAGLTLSAVGDQLYAVALVWVAVGVFGPAAGYLSAWQAGGGMMAALLAGRWADRWPHRRAMAGADLVGAAILLGLVGGWLGRGGPPPTALAAAIVVLAAGEAVFRPALAATLPSLLPSRGLLPAANALFDTMERSARLLGPGLVGALAGVLPVVHFFSLDMAAFLLSAAAVPAVGLRGGQPGPAPCPSVVQAVGRGFAVARRHRLLWSVSLLSGPINGLWVGAFYLGLPLLIEQAGIRSPGGTGLGGYGLVISAYGCTNLLATLVIGSRPLPAHPARMMFTGSVIVGVGTAALAFGEWGGLPALMAAAAFGAVGGPMKDIPVAVLRQTELPSGGMSARPCARSWSRAMAACCAPWRRRRRPRTCSARKASCWRVAPGWPRSPPGGCSATGPMGGRGPGDGWAGAAASWLRPQPSTGSRWNTMRPLPPRFAA